MAACLSDAHCITLPVTRLICTHMCPCRDVPRCCHCIQARKLGSILRTSGSWQSERCWMQLQLAACCQGAAQPCDTFGTLLLKSVQGCDLGEEMGAAVVLPGVYACTRILYVLKPAASHRLPVPQPRLSDGSTNGSSEPKEDDMDWVASHGTEKPVVPLSMQGLGSPASCIVNMLCRQYQASCAITGAQ